ncbi:MAG TPA: histidinol-phosphatase [Streptosporangiaceae bacterium]
MIDYHVHLWQHGRQPSLQATVEQLAEYCQQAAALGISELAVTEHSSRFRQFDDLVGGWWDADPSPDRRAEVARKWQAELGADLDQYVDTALAAKAAGLPVVLGLEVDYHQGQMDAVGDLLAGYPFDVLLGSVHWIGAWMFNALSWTSAQQEWSSRSVEQVWDSYTRALTELAATRSVDVLAHPDVVKVAARLPAVPGEFFDRIAEAARDCGLAAELNSSGWRRPCAEPYGGPDLLARLRALNVPVTTASDGHRLEEVSWRVTDLTELARSAGYTEVTAFRARKRTPREI